MAALDTLYFDLKINDLTGEQIEKVKNNLKTLGASIDLGKLGNGDGLKLKVSADTSAAEAAIERIRQLVSKGGMSSTEISELKEVTKAFEAVQKAAEKANAEIRQVSTPKSSNSGIQTIDISRSGDSGIIEKLKSQLEPYNQALANLKQKLEGVSSIPYKDSFVYFLTREASKNVDEVSVKVRALEETMRQMGGKSGSITFNYSEPSEFERQKQAADLEVRKRVWKQWAEEQDKIDKQQSEYGKRAALNAAERAKEEDNVRKQAELENNAMIRLKATIESMELAMRRYQAASDSLGKPQSIEAAIYKMREYISLARESNAGGGASSLSFMRNNTLSMGASNIEKAISTETQLERQRQRAQAASEAQEKLAASHYRASIAADSHTRASIRLGSSLTGLVSITGDLRNQVGMLVSAYTFEHLLKNVVEIGGEFEKQKLAMSSMLGSVEQADDIFNRMKNLALTSPFNFKDLSNYSRQLTAYGTSYKDLYDTTNRLADISAGLGGDMSRLVLAFSQVKAASVLRGQEMRQFTEFGVSLPELLAKKYTEAEGRIVTAGDVIERVSKKMVSFNDVKDVLWKETDKGGRFYDMQSVLAQSTSGMASNLKDSIDTMYYDIANSNSGMIKDSIKAITELINHWRELSSVLLSATSVYAIYRLGMAASNRIIGIGTAETLKGVMASKQEEASILRRKAMYGELNAEQKAFLATSKVLTFDDVKRLASSKAINSEALIRLVNTRKITAEQALQLSSTLALSGGEVKYLTTLKSLDTQLAFSTSKWGTFTTGVQKNFVILGNNIKMMVSGIKSALATILSPINVLMAGAFVGLDVYMEHKQQMDHLDEINKQTIKNAEDGNKSLNEFLASHPIEMVIKGGDKNEIEKLVDAYKEQITSTPLDMSGFITNIDTISDATQKLQALRDEMQAMRDADKYISKNGNAFAQSQKNDENWTPDWFNSINKGLISVGNFALTHIGHIPSSWTQDLRNYAMQWQENGKSMEGVLSDVASSTDDLNNEMSKLNNNDIDAGLEKLRSKIPQLASEIDNMRKAGASNNEVIKAMLTMAREHNITLFEGIDANTFDDYANNVKVMSNRMAFYIEDGINRINSSMSKADVEGRTERWKLAVIKSSQEQAKAWNLTGDALEQWTFMIESYISKNSARIKDHPKAWQDMYNGIRQILAEKGIDINNATKEQANAAFQTYKNETSKTKPWMKDWLDMMNEFTRNNPIYIWSEMRAIGAQGGTVLQGRGRELANDQVLYSKYKKELSEIVTDNDVTKVVKGRYDEYQQDLKDAKANRKSTDQIKKDWKQFRDDWNAKVDVDFITAGLKTPKQKKTHVDKKDYFAEDMRSKIDQVKKAMDVYKKWKSSGVSDMEAIDKMDASGVFPKGTFAGKDTEKQLNEWYKKTLENLRGMLNRAKSNVERKKIKISIGDLIGDYDIDETKRKLDDLSKSIEKLISDTVDKWDFFKKVKDKTGNGELASQLAFGGIVKGKTVKDDLRESYNSNEVAQKSGVSFDSFLKMTDSEMSSKGISSLKSIRDKYLSEEKKLNQETVDNLLDLIEKHKDYAQQITDIENKLSRDLLNIDSERTNLTKSGVDVDRLKKSTRNDANEKISKIKFESFKTDTDWATIFGDLDKVSNRTLSNMTQKLRDMTMNANLGVDEIKAIQEALKKIEDENLGRNPFKGFVDAAESAKRWRSILSDIENNGTKDAAGNKSYTYKRDDVTKGVKKGQRVSQSEAENGLSAAYDNEGKAIDNVIKGLKSFSEVIDQVSSMLENFGVSGGSAVTNALGAGLNGAVSLGGGLKSAGSLFGLNDTVVKKLGIWGAAAGAAIGIIGSIASIHDKKIEQSVENSKRKVKELDDEYKRIEDQLKYYLGDASKNAFMDTKKVQDVKAAQDLINNIKTKKGITIFDLKSLELSNKLLKDNAATVEYLKTGNAYNYQRDLYEEQLEEAKKQRELHASMKKQDKSKLEEDDRQIDELQTKVSQFSLNLANSLYGIDIKAWASELGDALFEAWQKGESGADAFKKKVNEIIANVANKWAVQKIVEPAMKKMMTNMVGEDGKGGWFGKDNNMSADDMANKLAPDLNSVQESITKYNEAMGVLSEALKKQGINIQDTSSTSSTANAINGVSEQEGNIIAAYMDAIRQDTYTVRIDFKKLIDNMSVTESPIMQAQLQQLTQIQSNTYRNMVLVGEIKSLLNDFSLGNKKIYIN